MSGGALITMILILGVVVGGFVGFLTLALKQEARRVDAPSDKQEKAGDA